MTREEIVEALRDIEPALAIADRKTVEFDRAKAAVKRLRAALIAQPSEAGDGEAQIERVARMLAGFYSDGTWADLRPPMQEGYRSEAREILEAAALASPQAVEGVDAPPFFLPLTVKPLDDPKFDRGENIIMDADTGHIAVVSNRTFAEWAVRAINAYAARSVARGAITDAMVQIAQDVLGAHHNVNSRNVLRFVLEAALAPAPAQQSEARDMTVRECADAAYHETQFLTQHLRHAERVRDKVLSLKSAAPAQDWRPIETARPISEYHEDMGDVLWWKFPVNEPPYVGSPNDLGRTVQFDIELTTRTLAETKGEESIFSATRMVGGWPGYHTHFTLLSLPTPLAETKGE